MAISFAFLLSIGWRAGISRLPLFLISSQVFPGSRSWEEPPRRGDAPNALIGPGFRHYCACVRLFPASFRSGNPAGLERPANLPALRRRGQGPRPRPGARCRGCGQRAVGSLALGKGYSARVSCGREGAERGCGGGFRGPQGRGV